MKEVVAVLVVVWGLCSSVSCGWIPNVFRNSSETRTSLQVVNSDIRQFISDWLSGSRALAKNAEVIFHWDEPMIVGNTVSFTVQVCVVFNLYSQLPIELSCLYTCI